MSQGPVNLTYLLEGLLAAEMASEDLEGVPVQIDAAMLRGAVHAAVKLLLDAEVSYDASMVASLRTSIMRATVRNAYAA